MENLRDAVEAYSKAIDLNSEQIGALNNRGNIYVIMRKYEEAIADYSRVIAINPTLATMFSKRGRVFNIIGNYVESLSDFTKAITIDPKVADSYSHLGLASVNLGDYEIALEYCNTAIKLDPNHGDAYHTRAQAWLHFEEFDKALDEYTRSIELKSAIHNHSSRGMLYARLGTNDLMEADFQAMMKMLPENKDSVKYFIEDLQKDLKRDYMHDDHQAAIDFINRCIEAVQATLEDYPHPFLPPTHLLVFSYQRANDALLGSLAPVPKPQFVLRMWLNAFALGLFL
jgi:tetratricopeptide (TPR) repeat protein